MVYDIFGIGHFQFLKKIYGIFLQLLNLAGFLLQICDNLLVMFQIIFLDS